MSRYLKTKICRTRLSRDDERELKVAARELARTTRSRWTVSGVMRLFIREGLDRARAERAAVPPVVRAA